MTNEKDFKVKINRRDIAEITESTKQFRIEAMKFIAEAPYEDIITAHVLLALQDFLRTRRVEPDFEVVLSE